MSPTYTVAVRTLCEFTARQGDLDLRFTPSPSAQEGIEGHGVVTSRRKGAYQAEVSLTADFGSLRVRGRADGYDPAGPRVEEIKTFRGDLARQPENHRQLHWAQVQVYGWLLCRQFGLPTIELALVYFDVDTHAETVLTRQAGADDLRLHFEAQCMRFLAWAEQEAAHRTARDDRLSALRFPHGDFRGGQRELAESVYKAAKAGRCLVAQAPTGIGKTVGTLFPLLKACPAQGLDKVYFLTAKTSGRQVALDALGLIAGNADGASAAPLRVIELVARDKVCEHPDKSCHGDSCPLARGFYDRLPEARAAAAGAVGPWNQAAVRGFALAHGICPYYLAQELTRWCDVAVGDYNHYFDLNAMLHGLAQANQWRVGVLVDEAHNLLERARRMYTAALDQSRLDQVRRSAPAALRKPLDGLHRSWNAMNRELLGPQAPAYQVGAAVPESFRAALQRCLAALSDHDAEVAMRDQPELLGFFFDALRFSRLVDRFDEHSLFDLSACIGRTGSRARTPPTVACVRNVIPAPFLTPRLAAAHSVTLFSATLKPWRFYGDTLGLPADTAFIDVASPFGGGQLSVRIARHISTRYRDRAASLQGIVQLMAQQWHERPGNYLAFFSSHEYLGQVAQAFAERHGEIPQWRQSPRMEEGEQARFIERFAPGGRGIGFAVLGGSFSEGIDLPGDRLIGAFIATLGLPQVNAVNEQFKQRIGKMLGQGEAYTYLYPGLQKVVQAAGRVIRTTTDEGVVVLIDDRFRRAEVRRLLPAWWRVEMA